MSRCRKVESCVERAEKKREEEREAASLYVDSTAVDTDLCRKVYAQTDHNG